MPGISETCSVCGDAFDVQFRYQMEERGEGFSFFCSQRCLEKSQVGGDSDAAGSATCGACAKRFRPDLVSQVFYLGGRRTYACSFGCRSQLIREASGMRLGDIAAAPAAVDGDQTPTPHLAAVTPTPAKTEASLPAVLEPRLAASVANTPGPAAAEVNRPPMPRPMPRVPAGPARAVPTVPRAPTAAPQRAAVLSQSPPSKAAATRSPEPQPLGVPRYLAVFNHKGGTGKTTTAVSIAAGLASRGKRVLLVDTDAQGNVAVSLGTTSERSLYHVLVMGLRVADATKLVRPNLHLLPSNETLAAAELYLAGRQNRDRVLSERLASAAGSFDYVVLDCSPSLSLMNQNALVFADSVLVPVACDYLSLVGVRQVIKTVKNVNALLHHPVQIWGVLPTFYDSRARICREAVTTLKGHFGDRCLSPIRAAIKVKEAPAQGQTIFEYAEGASAAEDYLAVVDRIVTHREAAAPRPAAAAVPMAEAAGASGSASGAMAGAPA